MITVIESPAGDFECFQNKGLALQSGQVSYTSKGHTITHAFTAADLPWLEMLIRDLYGKAAEAPENLVIALPSISYPN